MNAFGDFLRQLRGKMTYREAAEKSGISHAYIRYLEIGKRPGTNTPINPSPEMLKGLANAYNHSYKDLMIKAGYDYEEAEERKGDMDDPNKLKMLNILERIQKEDLAVILEFAEFRLNRKEEKK